MWLCKACILFLITSVIYASDDNYFLTLADIHFNPFSVCQNAPCPIAEKLNAAPANQWSSIFNASNQVETLNMDTNNALFNSTLIAAKKIDATDHAKFILILGDFLSHDIRESYRQYLGKSKSGYAAFIKKTFQFLVSSLQQQFPNTNIYVVLGNNDSYQGDYQSYPNGQFFHDMSSMWSTVIRDPQNRQAMQSKFPIGGYYAITLPDQPGLRLIVLNTTFFSTHAKGAHIDQAANQQLNWLHAELKLAYAKQQKVIIAMHIPQSIDVHITPRFFLFTLIELWKTNYRNRFQAEIRQFASIIGGIFTGHLHKNWLQYLNINDQEIPVRIITSVSPVYGNYPGFRAFRYTLHPFELNDAATYTYAFSNNTWETSGG